MSATARGIPVSKASQATLGFTIPQTNGEARWYSIDTLPEAVYRQYADASGRSRQEAVDAAIQARTK